AHRVAREHVDELLVERRGDALLLRSVSDRRARLLDDAPVLALHLARELGEQLLALRELAREIVLARLHLALDLPPPRGEAVDPALDGELPAAAAVDAEEARPAV